MAHGVVVWVNQVVTSKDVGPFGLSNVMDAQCKLRHLSHIGCVMCGKLMRDFEINGLSHKIG